MIHSEFASHSSRRVAPRGDAVAAEDAADRLRVRRLDRGDVEPELEAGAAPRHPHDLVAEDLLGQRLAVGGGRDRDAGVGVQVVDVRGVDEAVHRGVDRRRGAALAVQAVVERGDHLVLALDARVDVGERAQAVEAQHGEARLGQRAEVAAGALHPEQLDRLAGDRVGLGALGGGVAAGVVRVLRVGAEAVGAGDERRAGWSWSSLRSEWSRSVPAGLGAADAVGGDLLLVAATPRRPPSGRPGRPRDSRQAARSGADVGVERVHQDAVRAEHVAARPAPRRARRGRRAARGPSSPARSAPSGSGRGSCPRCCGTGRA